jgi:SAM-dependent MidA family methyltransferase
LNTLIEIIAGEAQKRGVISFARFMELTLYCPVYGYYEKDKDTIGRRGDFFTSVSVGSLFGELLAFQFAEWLDEVRSASSDGSRAGCKAQIVEAGAHDGELARDILNWLRENRAELFHQCAYWILEPSARRQQRQRETLADFGNKTHWVTCLEELASEGVFGIIVSNELLDAMPVHRLSWNAANKEWLEWGVAVKEGHLVWARLPRSGISNLKLQISHLPGELLNILPDGFSTEVCPAAQDWWSEAAGLLRRGKLLTIDYGLTAEEFFSPGRSEGTLRAYYRHHLSRDLLARPGEQDLTADVNFTAVQSAGEAAGLRTEQFASQAEFLTHIAERVWGSRKKSGEWFASRNRQFQTLTHPEHLGRRFRVLIQAR